MVKIIFVNSDDTETELEVPEGTTVLEAAHDNDVPLEGACEGSLACSTCHVIIEPEFFEMLEEPSEDEEDMLDLAFNLQETSRLGCQVVLNEELDGIRVRLPGEQRSF